MAQTYQILGADGQEYGPAPVETIHQWIREGRADGNIRVRPTGETEWRPLRSVPELARALPAGASPGSGLGSPPSGPSLAPPTNPLLPTEAEILARDYDLPVFELIGEGWQVLSRQFANLIGASAIMMGIMLGLGLVGAIPLAGLLTSPVAFIISGPLFGGLWHVMVRAKRGEQIQPAQVFDGFRDNFAPLLLNYLVTVLGGVVVALPGIILIVMGAIWSGMSQPQQGAHLPAVALIVLGSLVAMGAGVLLWSLWWYSWELVMDRKLAFWPALELSRKMAARHLFQHVLLFLALGVLLLLGYLACIVGVFLTSAWVYATYACAYDRIFGPRPAVRE